MINHIGSNDIQATSCCGVVVYLAAYDTLHLSFANIQYKGSDDFALGPFRWGTRDIDRNVKPIKVHMVDNSVFSYSFSKSFFKS